MKLYLLSATLLATALPAMGEQQTFATDPGHTEVRFGWDHAGVSFQHGEFDRVEGTLTIDTGNVETAMLDVSIDAASVSTGFGPLDEHVRSSDFLHVDENPTVRFVSTSVRQTGDTTAEIVGDLTIRGTTLPVTLQAELIHHGAHPVAEFIDYYEGEWLGFRATGEFDADAFGVGEVISVGMLNIDINTELKAQ